MLGRIFVFLFAIILAAPVSAGPVDTKEVERRVNLLMERDGMVGLAVAIVENGEVTYAKGFGETQSGSGNLVSADTVFRWASVSISVAATTVVYVAAE